MHLDTRDPYMKLSSNNIKEAISLTEFKSLVKSWAGPKCQCNLYLTMLESNVTYVLFITYKNICFTLKFLWMNFYNKVNFHMIVYWYLWFTN